MTTPEWKKKDDERNDLPGLVTPISQRRQPDEKEGTVRSAVKSIILRPLLTTRGQGGDETTHTLSLSLGRLLLSNRRLLQTLGYTRPPSTVHSVLLIERVERSTVVPTFAIGRCSGQ